MTLVYVLSMIDETVEFSVVDRSRLRLKNHPNTATENCSPVLACTRTCAFCHAYWVHPSQQELVHLAGKGC